MHTSSFRSHEGMRLIQDSYRVILESAPFPIESRYIDTRYGNTHIACIGDPEKPALILVHGTLSNSAAWFGSVHELSKHFSLYCLDLPGEAGLSDPVRIPMDSTSIAEWIEDCLGGLGISSCCGLGMSLGSWALLSYAIRHTTAVQAIGLVGTSGIAAARSSFFPYALLCMLGGRKGMERLSKSLYYKESPPEDVFGFQELVSRHMTNAKGVPPLFTGAELATLRMPILYLGGDHDILLNTQATAKQLETHCPKAECTIMPKTGHIILNYTQEVSDFFNRQVQ